MLEFTGISAVLRGLGLLYWGLAMLLLIVAIRKGKDTRHKAIWSTIVVLVFGLLPGKQWIEEYQRNVYAKEAWAYFKKKCAEKSGEKIYKTYTGVKSVLVTKPLPASDRARFI